MNAEQTPTPRPWRQWYSATGKKVLIGATRHEQVGTISDKANATLIVRAVNRDPLFEDMKFALIAIEERCGILTDEEFGYGRSELMQKVSDLLVKVKEAGNA